ncbi:hypothetical protein MKW98_015026 [Papaver atlanticum]|uniref:PABC domain-containing protein n=1 Tax=Papaver atlanticum TaxID=357466 RepID=A0AAD4S9A8_9MAGN|nr:hypothetical protein MKW98_015026 [Papaver atlanticum]
MSTVEAHRNGPVHIKTLASTLASAEPKLQRQMLGEQLFPLVKSIEHDYAGKVTCMLLEMDKTEVLHLLESPDALKKKVSEFMELFQVWMFLHKKPLLVYSLEPKRYEEIRKLKLKKN